MRKRTAFILGLLVMLAGFFPTAEAYATGTLNLDDGEAVAAPDSVDFDLEGERVSAIGMAGLIRGDDPEMAASQPQNNESENGPPVLLLGIAGFLIIVVIVLTVLLFRSHKK
ncbi:hypothetical protein [Halobacillus litoralis]|uniref:hypothetical protein n=1 Tax=Halobacillus litoralis TaxID=45668 RepID=UPI001CFEF6EE|nr:hypothetical protein [Halobacillus litoralis]